MDDYIDQYKKFYENGGYGNNDVALRYKEDVKKLVSDKNIKTILDYGCGECLQYSEHKMHEYWGIETLYCYDPAIPEYDKKPNNSVDMVFNTDVLEHIPETDLDSVLKDIFYYAEKVVFFSIATSPARAILPNGENAHCTLFTHQRWVELIDSYRTNQYVEIRTWGRSPGKTILK